MRLIVTEKELLKISRHITEKSLNSISFNEAFERKKKYKEHFMRFSRDLMARNERLTTRVRHFAKPVLTSKSASAKVDRKTKLRERISRMHDRLNKKKSLVKNDDQHQ